VPQIEQAVYLGQMAIQPACQFGLPHASRAHRLIEGKFRLRQGGERDRCATAGRGISRGEVLAIIDVQHERGLDRVYRARESLFAVIAEGVDLWNGRNLNANRSVGIFEQLYLVAPHGWFPLLH
jgi:hypothetical protein